MATREEIRETIQEFLDDYDKDNGNPAVDWAFILQHRLSEKDVVIKVARELPELPYCYHHLGSINLNCFTCGNIVGQRNQRSNILKAGYVATESLIGEKWL